MKNILVLTDFSQSAKCAEEYALNLAIKIHANIILYNAYPGPFVMPLGENLVWPHGSPVSVQLQSMSNLQARVNELKALPVLQKEGYIPGMSHLGSEGSLADSLNEAINKNNIWLVIMGTKGEGFAHTALFGSNVYKVLKSVDCPVLVVPENAVFNNAPKIVYADDNKNNNRFVIEWLHDFSEMIHTELQVAQVLHDDQTGADIIKKNGATKYGDHESEAGLLIFPAKNIEDSLHEITEQMSAGIIALIHRKHRSFERLFHKSTSYKMLRHTKIPILIFPDAK